MRSLAEGGTLTLTDTAGTDTVTLDGIEYEVGDLFPRAEPRMSSRRE